MEWINGGQAYDAKAIWIEVAHRLVEEGRICSEVRCTARSEIAFTVEREGRKWEAGFCGAHGVAFAATQHGPDCTVGEPRRLDDDEALAGPLVQSEDKDQDGKGPTPKRAPGRGSDPRRPGGSTRRGRGASRKA